MNTRGSDSRNRRKAQKTGTAEHIGGGDGAMGDDAEPGASAAALAPEVSPAPPEPAQDAGQGDVQHSGAPTTVSAVPDVTPPNTSAAAQAPQEAGQGEAPAKDAQAETAGARQAQQGDTQDTLPAPEETAQAAAGEVEADQRASDEAAAEDPAAGTAPAAGAKKTGTDTTPSREISRLDHLLARITGKAASTTAPSNDNLSENGEAPEASASETGESTEATPPVDPAHSPTTAPAKAAPQGDAQAKSAAGASAATTSHQAPEGAAASGDGGGQNGQGAPYQDLEDDDDGSEWPNGWGPPSGQNVLRVLSKLMADLDSQPPPNAGSDEAAPGEAMQDGAEPDGSTDGQAQSDAASAPEPEHEQPGATATGVPAPGQQLLGQNSQGKSRQVRKAPARVVAAPPRKPTSAPARPILTKPATRAEAEHWRWVHETAPNDQPGSNAKIPAPIATPPAPAADASVAEAQPGAAPVSGSPQTASSPAAPTQQVPAEQSPHPQAQDQAAPHDLSPWMVEQPEFRRAFGTTVELPVEEQAPRQDEEASELAVASGWRWTKMLITALTVVVVFALAGYGLYEIRFAGKTPPSASGLSTTTQGAATVDAGKASSESLLPAPILPPGAEGSRVVRNTTTDISPAKPGEFSTFSRPAGSEAAQPQITIERTVVRPFADGSAGALAVSRFDALNVSAAKLIAAYDIDKAKDIVDDILDREYMLSLSMYMHVTDATCNLTYSTTSFIIGCTNL